MRPLYSIAISALIFLSVGLGVAYIGGAGVIREADKVFIVDRTGERWDVTQAASIGFAPEGFQFGIGRHAIRPLDDTGLADDELGVHPAARVIGVENGDDAHAYVVRKLTRHEIANTQLGEDPIAAAY